MSRPRGELGKHTHRRFGVHYAVGALHRGCVCFPVPIWRCGTCGATMKKFIGYRTFNNFNHLNFPVRVCGDECIQYLDQLNGDPDQRFAVVWIGKRWTPARFINEAEEGKAHVPLNKYPLQLKKGMLIFLAHEQVIFPEGVRPGVFAAVVFDHLEMFVPEAKSTESYCEALRAQGVEPVIIRDEA